MNFVMIHINLDKLFPVLSPLPLERERISMRSGSKFTSFADSCGGRCDFVRGWGWGSGPWPGPVTGKDGAETGLTCLFLRDVASSGFSLGDGCTPHSLPHGSLSQTSCLLSSKSAPAHPPSLLHPLPDCVSELGHAAVFPAANGSVLPAPAHTVKYQHLSLYEKP